MTNKHSSFLPSIHSRRKRHCVRLKSLPDFVFYFISSKLEQLLKDEVSIHVVPQLCSCVQARELEREESENRGGHETNMKLTLDCRHSFVEDQLDLRSICYRKALLNVSGPILVLSNPDNSP